MQWRPTLSWRASPPPPCGGTRANAWATRGTNPSSSSSGTATPRRSCTSASVATGSTGSGSRSRWSWHATTSSVTLPARRRRRANPPLPPPRRPPFSAVDRLDLGAVLVEDTAALELGRGCELVAVGKPFLGQDGDLAHALGRAEADHHVVDGPLELVVGARVVRELGQRAGLDAPLAEPAGSHLGVEHHQRRHEGPFVADGAGLSDGHDRLEGGFEVGRAHVLAPGGDDQLLLPIDDAEVAVVVELADVAGVERSVGIESVGGLARVVEVADEHVASAAQHLAVIAQPHVDAREGPANGADPHLIR